MEVHPKALLSHKRNVREGVSTRSQILQILERKPSNAKAIAEEAGISYSNVLHHLRLLEEEHIVRREGGKPYVWRLTGAGQQRLTEMITSS